jgi:hypothetical protein
LRSAYTPRLGIGIQGMPETACPQRRGICGDRKKK